MPYILQEDLNGIYATLDQIESNVKSIDMIIKAQNKKIKAGSDLSLAAQTYIQNPTTIYRERLEQAIKVFEDIE